MESRNRFLRIVKINQVCSLALRFFLDTFPTDDIPVTQTMETVSDVSKLKKKECS